MFKKLIKSVVIEYLQTRLWEYTAEMENRINVKLAELNKKIAELERHGLQ